MKRVIAVALLVIGCSESRDSHYADVDAVRRDGAIERGWIPEVIPESASDIYEWHDLDSNDLLGAFSFRCVDLEEFVNRLAPTAAPEVQAQDLRVYGTEWWHPKLRGRLHADELRRSDISVYTSGRFWIAIDSRDCRAYFWN